MQAGFEIGNRLCYDKQRVEGKLDCCISWKCAAGSMLNSGKMRKQGRNSNNERLEQEI